MLCLKATNSDLIIVEFKKECKSSTWGKSSPHKLQCYRLYIKKMPIYCVYYKRLKLRPSSDKWNPEKVALFNAGIV